MFKLEIKKIALKSVVLSGYPFVIFLFSLLTTLMKLGDVVSPGDGFFSAVTSILLYALFTTAAVVLYTLLAAFIYNILISIGLKGIRVSLSEVEEGYSSEEEEQAPAEQEQNNENK